MIPRNSYSSDDCRKTQPPLCLADFGSHSRLYLGLIDSTDPSRNLNHGETSRTECDQEEGRSEEEEEVRHQSQAEESEDHYHASSSSSSSHRSSRNFLAISFGLLDSIWVRTVSSSDRTIRSRHPRPTTDALEFSS